MAVNLSVKKFQRVMAALPEAVRKPIRDETFEQADELAAAQRDEMPVGGGALAASSRVQPSDRNPMRALVMAGGPLTTRGGYDYALAQEFGTQHQSAQPFFWPPYRANKNKIRKRIKQVAVQAISRICPLT